MESKILIYSNCQNVAYYMKLQSTYNYVLDNDISLNTEYNYILTQPMFNMQYNTIDILRKVDPQKVIIYPSYHLDCYYPSLTYIYYNSKLLKKPLDYHFKEIVLGYKNGLSVDDIYNSILNFNVSDEYIENTTILNLKHTNDNLNIFTNMCPNIIYYDNFIINNYKNHLLGYSMNHPTLFYMLWLVNQFKSFFQFEIINENIDIFKHIIMPIYPKIIKHYNFITDNYFIYNEHKLNIFNMINYYIESYNKLSPEDKEILIKYSI